MQIFGIIFIAIWAAFFFAAIASHEKRRGRRR
jgi:hypothetical protein